MSKAPVLPDHSLLGPSPRSLRKRQAILDAATDVFLIGGYLGTNMDQIAEVSAVSKQTVYKHFASKEALFVEIVRRLTAAAGGAVHTAVALPADQAGLAAYLRSYALRQLAVVLTPRLMQLRRLVIGEVSRFPELAKVLYDAGPQRAIDALTAAFSALQAHGLLALNDPRSAASHFNWLIMAEPLNQAMLLGDQAIPDAQALDAHVSEGVRVFLAAYGVR